ncbi:DUF1428 domain-containing protein [Aurantiacibacter odishensis]|uniref:DUF1428 domain-containing protein n=1 Tax=Aurantiacibacter odishensis TaxID=1155476 RepID=UPI000E765244|nr:DUF1428 domain-containing protein [Aurantiacibacter odishensis]
MRYFDGFVIPVPTGSQQRFIDHANKADAVFRDQGAKRIVEAWGDDIPTGKFTDFQGAVQAKDDETVVFSWIEWLDKQTRDTGQKKMMDQDFDGEMPFDGKRMIMGGFRPIVEL